ncbi:MAG TPA: hypothetical protein VGM79_22400 [Streptosporangiaceae bacterium]|jgi:outer membrane receptor protein involved in Fe transport
MRRPLAAALTLASTAALLGGAAVDAQASPAAAQASPAAAPAGPAAVRQPGFSGAEHFRIISVTASSRHQSVLATGAFTAGGYQVPGKVVGLRAVDKMVFPDGTFLVTRRITKQVLPLPTSSCQISETIRGTLSISGGTGSYRGMSGGGAFLLQISGVIRKSGGKCGGPMTVFQSINYEGGTVRG